MPRPQTKSELLELSQHNFQALTTYIDGLPESTQASDFKPGTLNRNIRDVLAHLHHWHMMMLDWYRIGMAGEKPDMPATGYTWKTVPALNQEIWAYYQHTDLATIRDLLNQSFTDLQTIIRQHSTEELFEKKRNKWTGSTSLGAYLISATSSHYAWALKLIRKSLRNDLEE